MTIGTPQEVLTVEFVGGFAERWLAAWNSADPARVAELCAEDVRWTDPALPDPHVGRAAVADFARSTFETFPDLGIEETAPPFVSGGSPTVLAPYRIQGTMRGGFDLFAATEARIVIDGVDEWTFRDGELAVYRTYYDSLGLARQLGVMPPAGSLAERGLARLQHVQARFQRARARRTKAAAAA